MKWKPRGIASKAIAIGVLVYASLVVGLAPAALAAGTRSGDAVPTNPNTQAPVTSGGSATNWTLNLPAQASCSGDTASGGFHVYSFIVPATTNPGSLTFNPSTGPSSGNPLVDNSGSAYIAANTAQTTGQIINIPTFNFNLFASTTMGGTKIALAPGDYKAGIACADTNGNGDKYWSTLFTFTASGSDPNGEVWTDRLDAAVIPSGCKATTTSGAGMGHYPAWPGSQSYMRVACIFNHSDGGTGDQTSATFTIHDFANAVYHNGAARTVTVAAAPAPVAGSFTVTDCTSATGFVNRELSGTGVPARAFVKSISGACLVTVSDATFVATVGASYTIDNAATRTVTNATLTPGTPAGTCTTTPDQITSATANFTAADTGLSVTGTNIPDGSTITFVNATTVNVSTCPPGPNQITAGTNQNVTFGGTIESTNTRTVNDAVSTVTNQISSASAGFQASDVGLKVTGTGITQPCYIATRNTGALVTLSSACATINAGPYTVTVGDPTATAPVATDTVLNQGAQLPLNPSLVAGSQPCAANEATGFGAEGTWLNPGSFVGGTFATQPAGTDAVGEILFKTSVINYGAYVVQMKAASDPLIGAAHFNIVFPNVPTSLALCPSTATSPGLGFSIGLNATTVSQAAIATGVGRPNTAQVRSTRASTTGSTSTIFITDDVNGAGVKWTGSEFNRVCIIPAGPPVINFACGAG
jgi:hypothetical protein